MLKSVSDIMELPYKEAREALENKIKNVVEAGETPTGEKIRVFKYVVECSSEGKGVTNKEILDALGIQDEVLRHRLSNSMGKMQGALPGYIGRNGGGPRVKYYVRDEVLKVYETLYGVSLKTDLLEILDGLLESHPITPEPYRFEPIFPGIPADALS